MRNSRRFTALLAVLLSACASTATQGVKTAQDTQPPSPSPATAPAATVAVESPPAPGATRIDHDMPAATARPSVADAATAPPPRPTTPAPEPAAPKPAARKPKPPAPVPAPAKPIAAAAAATPANPSTAELSGAVSGRIEFLPGPKQSVEPGEVAESVVYFLPQSGAPRPKPGRFSIGTQSKGFTPNLLVVPVGSTVNFPNTDTILHSVYSRSPGSSFDLKTYGPGQSRQTVLNHPGLVIVNCNVHHNMRANIVVLATPYFARPAADGSFRLSGLPTEPGTLVFWHPRANAVSQTVRVGASGPVSKKLTAIRPRIDTSRGAP